MSPTLPHCCPAFFSFVVFGCFSCRVGILHTWSRFFLYMHAVNCFYSWIIFKRQISFPTIPVAVITNATTDNTSVAATTVHYLWAAPSFLLLRNRLIALKTLAPAVLDHFTGWLMSRVSCSGRSGYLHDILWNTFFFWWYSVEQGHLQCVV